MLTLNQNMENTRTFSEKVACVAYELPNEIHLPTIRKELKVEICEYHQELRNKGRVIPYYELDLGDDDDIDCRVIATMGTICSKQPTNFEGLLKDVWIPIPKNYLENLQKKLLFYKKLLIRLGYLEVEKTKSNREKYLAKVFCKNYKVSPKYVGKTKKMYYIKNEKFLRSFNRLRENFFIKKEDPETKDFLMSNLRIHKEQALAYIELMYETGKINNEKYSSYYVAIKKIANKDFYSIIDDFSGRLHTNLTNLKSELRQFIYFEGQENENLMTLDIKNSQILGLSMLMNKQIRDKIEKESDLLNFRQIRYLDYLLKKSDVVEFAKICEQGHIYEDLQEKCLIEKIYERLSRKNMKTKTFVWLFSPYNCSSWVKDFRLNLFNMKVMDKYYPSVKKFVNSIRWMEDENGFKIPNLMPKMLQKLERFLVMEKICPKLDELGITYMTIHDSFVINQKYRDAVTEIIKNVFLEYDIKIALGIENYEKIDYLDALETYKETPNFKNKKQHIHKKSDEVLMVKYEQKLKKDLGGDYETIADYCYLTMVNKAENADKKGWGRVKETRPYEQIMNDIQTNLF